MWFPKKKKKKPQPSFGLRSGEDEVFGQFSPLSLRLPFMHLRHEGHRKRSL